MNNELKKWTESVYMKLYRKYLVSKTWFIILNVLSSILIASMVILNIYAIKKNPYADTKIYYVLIAIFSAFIGLLTSLVSFFTLNKNSNKYKEQAKDLRHQLNLYKKKEGKYESKERDKLILDEITNITTEQE